MSKEKLFVIVTSVLLLFGLIPMVNSETVPNPDHMIIARSNLPGNIDPALLWSSNDFELALNVYEPLIFYDRERINSFVPRLATSWNMSADGLNYTFEIRQGVKFHNNDTLTVEDVEYSFERILVMDINWPSAFLYDALFGLAGSRDEYGNIIVNASLLDGAITRTDTTVTFHLSRPYGPFLQVLSVFGFIVNKDWCIAHGEWPGTWNNWTLYNKPENSQINMMNTEPPGPHIDAMCGTGPFMLDYYQRGVNYSLVKFDDYWGGWPAPGANGFLQRVTVRGISDWATRRDLFLSGELDSVDVPRTSWSEVLGQPGVRCVYPLPELVCEAMFFTFNISTSSEYLGVPGGLPPGTFSENGIPPDFFNDINVRRGFAYSFNYTKLINDVLLGDSRQPATPIIPGLLYHNPAQEKYTFNLTKAAEYFQEAWNGQVWANGFNVTILYNVESIIRLRECEILKENVEALNPKFHVQIQGVTWNIYNYLINRHEAPIFIMGWLADFADPHDFAYGFMRSGRVFPAMQNYMNETIDELVDLGVAETNEMLRKEIYYELQRLYFEDCPAVTLFQPIGRRFEREWVQGWYYNTVIGSYGSNYFYVQWKEYIPPISLNSGENIVDDTSSTDTMVLINTTSPGNITINSYDINLEGTIEMGIEVHCVKCVTVETDLPPESITFPIEIRIYYTNQEVISAYVDQSTLRMFYWNGTSWILENDTGVVTPSDIPGYAGYVWAKIYHLSLFAIMGQPPPTTYSLTISTTTGGTTSPTPGTYIYLANSSVQVTAIPDTNYVFDHWELDTINVGSANPYYVLMDNNHTLKAVFTYLPPPPPLSVSISPPSASILVGQLVTFTSTVSGGYTPYAYQWYLNGNPVSGATSSAWAFTPTTSGIYYIYLKVTDDKGNTAQSDTARITVAAIPVGGYSIPINIKANKEPIIPYIMLAAILTMAFTAIKRKTTKK
ncbi:MAG: ABC transporter substrate-binding protein [Candidatus Bathyarchaeia archaeon]